MENLKQELARRFAHANPPMGQPFEGAGVVVEQLPTPFLRAGGIVRVTNRAIRMPRPFYAGFAGSEFAVLLAGNRDGFAQLCAQAGLVVDSDSDAAAFLRTMLETTATQPARFFLLSRADEIKPRPNMNVEEESSFRQILGQYASVIHAPVMRASASGWSGEAFALVNVDLVKFDVRVDKSGSFEVSESVLERSLPIPMVIH